MWCYRQNCQYFFHNTSEFQRNAFGIGRFNILQGIDLPQERGRGIAPSIVSVLQLVSESKGGKKKSKGFGNKLQRMTSVWCEWVSASKILETGRRSRFILYFLGLEMSKMLIWVLEVWVAGFAHESSGIQTPVFLREWMMDTAQLVQRF